MAEPTMLAVIFGKLACQLLARHHQAAGTVGSAVVNLVAETATGAADRRRMERLFSRMEERAAGDIQDLLGHEFRDLTDNERTATVLAAKAALDRPEVLDRQLFAADISAKGLAYRLRNSTPNRATAGFSRTEMAFYERLVLVCCEYLVGVAECVPGFQSKAFGEVLRRQTELGNGIRDVSETIERMSAEDVGEAARSEAQFAADYLRAVADKLDRLELFGVTLDEQTRRYPLSTAYIGLSADSEALRRRLSSQRAHGATGRDELPAEHVGELRIEDVLGASRRLLLRGEAGSGKTTLLQWLAVTAARATFTGDLAGLNGKLPVLLRLREHVGALPNTSIEFLAGVCPPLLAERMPPGWVEDLMSRGQVLMLVDGIDELPERRRNAAREWLIDLVTAYPDAYYVVTSRPAAVSENWLDRAEFDAAELLPMSPSDVRRFVAHWHEAMRAAPPDGEDLAPYERSLLAALAARGHLRALAETPLLCALLCALNRDRRMHLPRDRMDLYHSALEMLLERRDVERGLPEAGAGLSRADKTTILQHLAYWLIDNGLSSATRDQVIDRINACLPWLADRVRGMGGTAVLDHLLERSGLIREPAAERIDFVHRTFQEYLAAKQGVEADNIGALVARAHDDQWFQVVVMAAGHANLAQRHQLLRGLLDGAENEPKSRHQLHILAIACLETCSSLDPELREEIKRVADELLPPKRLSDAKALAGAGELLLDLLADREIRGAKQAAATIRTATAVGGESALNVIERCAAHNRRRVRKELLRAWPNFDPEKFARRALRKNTTRRYIELTDPGLVPGLRQLDLGFLRVSFDHGYGDISFVNDLSVLERLVVHDPALTDVSPLADHPVLHTLDLAGTGVVALAPLNGSSALRWLEVDLNQVIDPWSLRRLSQLRELTLRGHSDVANLAESLPDNQGLVRFALEHCVDLRNVRQLISLPQLSQLCFLAIEHCVNLTSLNGLECWADSLTGLLMRDVGTNNLRPIVALRNLTFLNIATMPICDLSLLDGLYRLRSLHIAGVGPLPDLEPLCGLTNLQQLWIWSRDTVDVTPLGDFPGRLTIHVPGGRAQVVGADQLGQGSRVRYHS